MLVDFSNNRYYSHHDSLTQFYADVNRYDLLTSDEEYELLFTYKNSKDENERVKARETLINCNQRFIIAMAKRFSDGKKVDVMDLINEGNIGLSEAIEKFEPNHGVKLISYAVWYIRLQINQYLIKHKEIVYNVKNVRLHHLLTKAINNIEQREERTATDEEIADELVRLTNDKAYGNVNDILPIRMTYLDNEDYLETASSTIVDFEMATASYNDAEELYEKDFDTQQLNKILNKLTPKDKNIIEYAYGIGKDRCYKVYEITDILNVAESTVRKSLIKTKEFIRYNFENGYQPLNVKNAYH